ncbi:hypothetical protein [Streptomyces flaveolus]|uniref:hypothetical protein n=1 Tax=Streptomyces flaveolus TaxID=67297 RepID=UPI0005616C95|nr:hypothetical protein [Streptomyces flaveolus]
MRLRKRATAAVLMSTAVFTALAPQAMAAPMPWELLVVRSLAVGSKAEFLRQVFPGDPGVQYEQTRNMRVSGSVTEE